MCARARECVRFIRCFGRVCVCVCVCVCVKDYTLIIDCPLSTEHKVLTKWPDTISYGPLDKAVHCFMQFEVSSLQFV